MNDPFDPNFSVPEAYRISDPSLDEYQAFHQVMMNKLGDEGGTHFAQMILWVRVGLPQRLEALGFDPSTCIMLSNSLMNYMLLEIDDITQGDLSEIVAVPPNAAGMTLSNEVLGKLNYGFELIAGRVEYMALLPMDGERLWDTIKELVDVAKSIGQGLLSSMTAHPYRTDNIQAKVTAYKA